MLIAEILVILHQFLMNIQELEKVYAKLPQVSALAQMLGKVTGGRAQLGNESSLRTIFLEGLLGSSAPMLFASLAAKSKAPLLFILQDVEEAGYFYHDLTQLMGDSHVFFFPSSYRRAIKYAQRDSASEILRTEVLAKLSSYHSPPTSHLSSLTSHLYIVTYPEAVAELVVSKKGLDARTLTLEQNQTISVTEIEKTLREFGFREVDYVYEPGQFALRGSGITSVKIGANIATIRKQGFMRCRSLIKVEMTDNTTVIEEEAFNECTALTSIKLSKNLETLGRYAFYGCEGLTSVTFPEGVTTIGYKFEL